MILIGPLLTIAVLAMALALGGRVEREAAWVLLAVLAVSVGLGTVLGLHDQLTSAIPDLILTVGFVALSVRHRRLWLYAESSLGLVLIGVQISSTEALEPSRGYRLAVDGVDLVGLAILASAVIAHRRRVRPGAVGMARLGSRAGR